MISPCPGKGEYSLMNVMAREGYDVWTMDHDGYGHSGSSGNNSDIASGVEDLKAAMPVITKETGLQKMHMYGTSSGGIRAAAYARRSPSSVDRLILAAYSYKGRRGGDRAAAQARSMSPRQYSAEARRGDDPLDLHPRRPSRSYDPAVPEAIIAEEMKFGDRSRPAPISTWRPTCRSSIRRRCSRRC